MLYKYIILYDNKNVWLVVKNDFFRHICNSAKIPTSKGVKKWNIYMKCFISTQNVINYGDPHISGAIVLYLHTDLMKKHQSLILWLEVNV